MDTPVTLKDTGLDKIANYFSEASYFNVGAKTNTTLGILLNAIIRYITHAIDTISRIDYRVTGEYRDICESHIRDICVNIPLKNPINRKIKGITVTKEFFDEYKKRLENGMQQKGLCKIDALREFATKNGMPGIFEVYANDENLIMVTKSYKRETRTNEQELKWDIILFLIQYAWAKNTPYYLKDERVEELAEDFFKLIENTPHEIDLDKVTDIFTEFLKKYPALVIDEEKLLEDLFTIDYAGEIDTLRNAINDYRYNIQDYAAKQALYYEKMQQKMVLLDGYLLKEKESYGKEIYRILEKYAPIQDYVIRDNAVYYTVKNATKVSDAARWKVRIKNYTADETLQELLYYACTTEEVNLYTSFTFKLTKDRGIDIYYHTNTRSKNTINHPHLYYFQCYGNNTSILNECLREKDFAAMIEQTIEIVGNVNYLDVPVVEKMVREIESYEKVECFSFKGRNFSYKEFSEEGEIYEAVRKCMEEANNLYN